MTFLSLEWPETSLDEQITDPALREYFSWCDRMVVAIRTECFNDIPDQVAGVVIKLKNSVISGKQPSPTTLRQAFETCSNKHVMDYVDTFVDSLYSYMPAQGFQIPAPR